MFLVIHNFKWSRYFALFHLIAAIIERKRFAMSFVTGRKWPVNGEIGLGLPWMKI